MSSNGTERALQLGACPGFVCNLNAFKCVNRRIIASSFCSDKHRCRRWRLCECRWTICGWSCNTPKLRTHVCGTSSLKRQPTLDATLKAEQLKLENENLQTELQELRRDLHESQEREARTVEKAQGRIAELEHRARESETGRTTELEKDVERLTVRCVELENHLSREAERAELERYRTLEVERRKWEVREDRLLEQLRRVEGQVRSRISPICVQDQELSEAGHSGGEPEMGGGISTASLGERASSPGGSATASPRPPPKAVRFTPVDQPELASPRGDESEQTYQSALSTALLAQQLPPIVKFSSESSLADGETFEAWCEQFKMVASVSHWDPQTKLVNLTTQLKGQAYTFYRSCAPHQRSSYDLLVAELMKRFTPVRLQSVQSSLFHERKQKASESVDAYAQDLCRLFHLAYPRARQGSQEAEDMGRSVLASQFVAGLLPDIKLKLAGVEGSLDELLVKARFQEAKLRDLAGISSMVVTKKPSVPTSQHKGFVTNRVSENQVRSKPGIKCFHCQGTGHFPKHCPLKGRAVPEESRGRSQWMANKERGARKVATIGVTSGDQPVDEKTKKWQRIAELRRQLQEAEVEETMAEVVAMMHVLQPGEQENRVPLGPTLTAEMKFEGRPVQALLDTGSPVTIVSLEFLLQTLAKQWPSSQTVAEWQVAVKARLKPTKCHLARREVEYLGYIVSEKGIAADPRKVEAVQTFPVPNKLKCLRSFLGLASYYRRFIQNFSIIANPLYALTRKDAVFDWSPACQEAFDRLKMVLTNAPLLAFPDFNRDFLLETDRCLRNWPGSSPSPETSRWFGTTNRLRQ